MNSQTEIKAPIYPERVLQFGGGNFIRAFADWMIDILNAETAFNGSVIVVKPTKDGDYNALKSQNGLFHVLTRGVKNGSLVADTHLVHCISKVVHPYFEWSDYVNTAEISNVRFIISNTTESGIRYKEEDYDGGSCPEEFPAKLTMWLHHRWKHFEGSEESGCIFLPCELIEDNAQKLKDCILQYIESWNLENKFKDWVVDCNHFCNTLVDRIVPGFPNDIKENVTFDDQLIVVSEPYHLWVIEAPVEIRKELPFHLTNLNVIFTTDLTPYRQMKVRILNGAHTAMVPIGYLNGIETVQAAVEDERIGNYIANLIYKEIIPTLDFPNEDLTKYARDVLDRFKNPYVQHKLFSISLNSISKFRHRLLPSLLEYKSRYNQLPDGIIAALAALIVFYRGKRKSEEIPLRDDPAILSYFKEHWIKWESKNDTDLLLREILSNQELWGHNLYLIEGLSKAVTLKVEERLKNDSILRS